MSWLRLALVIGILLGCLRPSMAATVNIEFLLGEALTSTLIPVSMGSKGILVVDVDGTGLPTADELVGITLSENGMVGSSRIVQVLSAVDFNENDPGFVSVFTMTSDGLTGRQLGFYWFPELMATNGTVTEGMSYGFMTSSTFVVPAHSENITADFLTIDLGGTYSNTAFRANLIATAVPEPTRMFLFLLGGAALISRRRRAA